MVLPALGTILFLYRNGLAQLRAGLAGPDSTLAYGHRGGWPTASAGQDEYVIAYPPLEAMHAAHSLPGIKSCWSCSLILCRNAASVKNLKHNFKIYKFTLTIRITHSGVANTSQIYGKDLTTKHHSL